MGGWRMVTDAQWLSAINRPGGPWRKWSRFKRCKFCGASVIWVEKADGQHVKLDSQPFPHGEWARNTGGIAFRPPVKLAHHGRWRAHDCANKPGAS